MLSINEFMKKPNAEIIANMTHIWGPKQPGGTGIADEFKKLPPIYGTVGEFIKPV
jgi:hypothetical protein